MSLIEGEQPCPDVDCGGVAEPEVDAGYSYYECGECGFQFGYARMDQPDETCALGIPEAIRRAASIEPPGKRVIPLMVKR